MKPHAGVGWQTRKIAIGAFRCHNHTVSGARNYGAHVQRDAAKPVLAITRKPAKRTSSDALGPGRDRPARRRGFDRTEKTRREPKRIRTRRPYRVRFSLERVLLR